MENLNKSTSGSGPEALPPKVLSRAPAGLTLVTSYLGMIPEYKRLMSSLNALAQPSLLSSTTITVLLSLSELDTLGSLWVYSSSTLKPTPVVNTLCYHKV
jgi:hypothetical protein